MPSNYVVRGEWLNGLSFKENDVVLYGDKIYVAIDDRPCYDLPPDSNNHYVNIPLEYLFI